MPSKPYITRTFTGKASDEDIDKQIEEWLEKQLESDYVLHSISEVAISEPQNSNVGGHRPLIITVVSRVTMEQDKVKANAIKAT